MESPEAPIPESQTPQENPYVPTPDRYQPVPSGIRGLLNDIRKTDVTVNRNFIDHLRELATNFGMYKQVNVEPANPGPLVQAWVLNEFWQKRTESGFRFFSPDTDTPDFQRLVSAKPDGTVTFLSDERVPQTIAEFDMMTVTYGQLNNVTLFEIKSALSRAKKGNQNAVNQALLGLAPKVRLVQDRWQGPILPSCVLLTLRESYSKQSSAIQEFTAKGGFIASLPQGFSELGPQLKLI
jgi:hypothetical protein